MRGAASDWAWRTEIAIATSCLVPRDPSFEAYRQAFDLVDLARYTLNSFLVAALVVPLSVLFASGPGTRWHAFRPATRVRSSQARFVALMVPVTACSSPGSRSFARSA